MKKYLSDVLLVYLLIAGSLFAVINMKSENKVSASEQSGQYIKRGLASGKVTPKEAEAIALQQVKGKVTKTELENEDGNLTYDVDVLGSNMPYELSVDADNGKILEIEKDD